MPEEESGLLKIVIASTFTATPLTPILESWLDRLGWKHEVRWADYDHVFQPLLQPAGALRSNKGGISVVLVRRAELGEDSARIEESTRDLRDAIASSIAASGAPHLVVVCPSGPSGTSAASADEALAVTLRELAGADVLGANDVTDRYPVGTIYDSFADREGHVPFTDEYFAALATMMARRIRVLRSPPKKAILVDCDDTLWGGICGEVGADGVVIDAPRLALQRFLLEQRADGVLLCVVSRNNEADALAVFERADMLLRREHLTTWRINWSPKSENIADIGRELGLGVDSFVLLDDDAYVCAEARERCSGLVALQLPEDTGDLPRFLNGLWVFDRGRVTDEDRRRAGAYRAHLEREQARAGTSHAAFLAKLELTVNAQPMQKEQVPRVAQLLHRTNQFNATGMRRSEAEVHALEADGLETFVVEVRDRFGDYGLTGVVIAGMRDQRLVVDTFALSCRVLGRGVEHHLVRQLAAVARERGASELSLPFVPTAKNAPYAAFFESLPARRVSSSGAWSAIAEATALLDLHYDPASAAATPGTEEREGAAEPIAPSPSSGSADAMDYRTVALTLSSVDEILRALPARARSASGEASAPAGVSLEHQLAQIWREVLNVDKIDSDADLFDIGGDSLVALRILTRVHREFAVEIPLHRLFQAEATIRWMAAEIRGSAA